LPIKGRRAKGKPDKASPLDFRDFNIIIKYYSKLLLSYFCSLAFLRAKGKIKK
jgi:hypothetical protein